MPNIAIINECNLRCPYCFADDMIENQKDDKKHKSEIMSIDDFKKVLTFCSKSNSRDRIGIIGGEPTLHPQIFEILKETENYCLQSGSSSTVFTNGIHLDKIVPMITKDLFSVLVNVNSPKVIGEANYNKIVENLELVYNVFTWFDKVSIGLNVYHELDDYTFFYNLIEKFKLKRIRISFVAPTYKNYKSNKEDYYKKAKDKLLNICREINKRGAVCGFDCNRVPVCYFTDKEIEELNNYVSMPYTHNFCNPVVDINPKFEAVRCFGCYDPVSIFDFNNLEELNRFFIYKQTSELIEKNKTGKCLDCKAHQLGKCDGGCLSFACK